MTPHAAPRRVRRMTLCLIIAMGALGGMVSTGATPVHATSSTAYGYTGTEQIYTVPAGVTSVTITASGGVGGETPACAGAGGYGALVTATVAVTPNQVLYVDVGSAGSIGAAGHTGPLVTGGAGGTCGGGGGASTVQTCSILSASCAANYWNANPALEPRLVVAGGGGDGGGGCSGGDAGGSGAGGGQGIGLFICQGGGGGGNGNGSAGAWDHSSTDAGGGATQSGPGAGGGGPGHGMVGGDGRTGSPDIGGAGGGGYYGGGGGTNGAGGGAGSSWAKPGSSGISYANDTAETPLVTISPASATPPAPPFAFTGTEQTYTVPAGVTSVTITASGGAGGSLSSGHGGYGALVTATVAVTPNETLYIDVGSLGALTTGGRTGPITTGGTAASTEGGGGATVVQTCSISASACTMQYWTASEPRLVVAGGGGGATNVCSGGDAGGPGVGGGAGAGNSACTTLGGGGGNGNGSAGAATDASYSGGGATQSSVGAGASSGGLSGSGMTGGEGGPVSPLPGGGAGGGGGYYGGGGGGLSGGGGAGSSWAATTATHVSYANDTNKLPIVMITPTNDLSLTGGQSINVTENVTFFDKIGSLTDPDDTAGTNDITLSVNWGDGSTAGCHGLGCFTAGPVILKNCTTSGSASACDIYGLHTYTAESSSPFTITITGSDSTTLPAQVTSSATISAGADDTTLTPGSTWMASEGASHTQVLGHWSDTDGGTPEPADAVFAAAWPDGKVDYCTTYASSLPSCFAPSSALQLVSCNGGQTSCDVQDTHTTSEESEPGGSTISLFATDPDQMSPTLLVGIPMSTSDAALTAGSAALTLTNNGNPAGTCSQGITCSGIVTSFVDASASCSGEGETVSSTGAPHYLISINWGDGSAPTAPTAVTSTGGCGYSISGGHVYALPGSKSITVTITDEGCADNSPPNSGGCSLVQTAGVMVAAVNDAAITGARQVTGAEGTPVTGTVGSISDADNTGPPDWSLTINWGDGTTPDTCTVSGPTACTYSTNTTPPAGAAGTIQLYACDSASAPTHCLVQGTHTYAAENSYAISLSLTDADQTAQPGGAASSAVISPDPDDTTLTPGATWTAVEGASHTQVLGHWSDTDGGTPEPADATFAAAWPDGHVDACSTYPSSLPSCFSPSSALQLVSCNASKTSCDVRDTASTADESEPGAGPVSLFATDPDQMSPTLLVGIPMGISDTPLTATGGNALTGSSNAPCSQFALCSGVVASVTDTNPSCTGEGEAVDSTTGMPHYAISISWGDGSASTVPTSVSQSSPCHLVITGSHTYTAPGTYTITVTITDEGCADTTPANSGGCSITIGGQGSSISNTVTVSTPASSNLSGHTSITAFPAGTGPSFGFEASNTTAAGLAGLLFYKDSSFILNAFGASGAALPQGMTASPTWCSSSGGPGCTLTIDAIQCSSSAATVYGHYVPTNGMSYAFRVQVTPDTVHGVGSFQLTANSPVGMVTTPVLPATAIIVC